jgi:hypothetical protein
MVSSGMLRRVALVRTDVSEELSTSFIRMTRIGELGTTQAVTSNRRTLHRRENLKSYTVRPWLRNIVLKSLLAHALIGTENSKEDFVSYT